MKWKIDIPNLAGGFAPAWYRDTYPSTGNKNQAGAMTNMDMTAADFITQGNGVVSLIDNSVSGSAVSTLVKGITRVSSGSSAASYGVGGNKIYRITNGEIQTTGAFPLTLDRAGTTTEALEDVAMYYGTVYVTYSYDAVGDIARFSDNPTSPGIDVDFASTVPTGAGDLEGSAIFNTPRQLCVAGNGKLYFANGAYVGWYDGASNTIDRTALYLGYSRRATSIQWAQDRLWVAVNNINLHQTANRNLPGSVVIWDGVSDKWDKEIFLGGKVGGIYAKEDVVYVFWQDNGAFDTFYLGYSNGSQVVKIAQFTGSLPAFYQISEYQNFLIWVSDNKVYAFGAPETNLPARLFQLCEGAYSTIGGIGNPVGTPYIASTDNSGNYQIGSFSGYTTDATWKSILFDITGQDRSSAVDTIRFNFNKLEDGARVDWSLVNSKGETVYSDTISYDKLGAATTAWYNLNGRITENFRIEFDFSNGSTTVPVKLKSIQMYGTN